MYKCTYNFICYVNKKDEYMILKYSLYVYCYQAQCAYISRVSRCPYIFTVVPILVHEIEISSENPDHKHDSYIQIMDTGDKI